VVWERAGGLGGGKGREGEVELTKNESKTGRYCEQLTFNQIHNKDGSSLDPSYVSAQLTSAH